MKAITYSAARRELAMTMKNVCEDHDPVIITRKNSQSVIMISLEDYEAMQETAYLMQSPENSRRLTDAIKELESGQGMQKELLE